MGAMVLHRVPVMVPFAIEDLAGRRVVVERGNRLRRRRLRGRHAHGARRHKAGRQVGRAAQQPAAAAPCCQSPRARCCVRVLMLLSVTNTPWLRAGG